jgi:hypothetical protein
MNIKKVISEAFNELYSELFTEAIDVQSAIERAKRTGRGPAYNFEGSEGEGEPDSAHDFNTIIDALVDDYIETGNPKSREAIQAAFSPSYNKVKNVVHGRQFFNHPKSEDALSAAYEESLLQNFDKLIDAYRKGDKSFSGLVVYDMRNKFTNHIKGGGKDVFGRMGDTPASMEDPTGDNLTLGSMLSSRGGSEQDYEAKEGEISKLRDALETTVTMMYNKMTDVDAEGNETFKNDSDKRKFAAFEGLITGTPHEEIMDKYPGLFKKPTEINIYFGRAVNSPEAAEVSEMISDTYGVNLDLSSIDPKFIKHTSAQSKDWGAFSKEERIRTPEMKAAWKDVQDVMATLGLKDAAFNTDKKVYKIVQNLRDEGNEEKAEEILNVYDAFLNVKKREEEKGRYGAVKTFLPTSEPEEVEASEFGSMFEGLSEAQINMLMERVLKRLSK